MKGSYAQDLALSLQLSLSSRSSDLITTPRPGSPTFGTTTASTDETPQDDRITTARSTYAALDASTQKHPLTLRKLQAVLDRAFPSERATVAGYEHEEEDRLLMARLTISACSVVIGKLIEEAEALAKEDQYWCDVESDRWKTGMFLLQSTPSRMLSVGSLAVTRLRAITTSSLHSVIPSQSLFSLSTFRTALPSSVVLAAIFPHLLATLNPRSEVDVSDFSQSTAKRISRRTKKLLFLPLSPLMLTRGEVTARRGLIRSLRSDLAHQIGTLTLSLSTSPYLGEVLLEESLSSTSLINSTWSTILLLESTVSPLSDGSALETPPPPHSSDHAHRLRQFLTKSFPSRTESFSSSFESVRRPGVITRTWPYLLSLPLFSLILGRTIYKTRHFIKSWLSTIQETVRGFVVDWVIQPVGKILETVRHGENTALSLIGKESLRSDLESLERMVVDFGRDTYGLSGNQLTELAEKVKVGDLTSVLRVWEADIKSPIRSAVSGSLIRTLLIQVQKVKVDVALAMDGIEKMLRSQQLTFAFVGVAPSLIISVALLQWIRGLFSSDGSEKNTRTVRLRNWSTMRHLDSLLSPRSVSTSTPTTSHSSSIVQGYLLLELHSLRMYAQSSSFPSSDTQLREAFLEDVRELENSGTEAEWEVRRVLIERLWRWAGVLRWGDIL